MLGGNQEALDLENIDARYRSDTPSSLVMKGFAINLRWQKDVLVCVEVVPVFLKS
jgi:hypothetical protein